MTSDGIFARTSSQVTAAPDGGGDLVLFDLVRAWPDVDGLVTRAAGI